MTNTAKTTTKTVRPDSISRHNGLKAMLEQRRVLISEDLRGRIRSVRADGATRAPEACDSVEIAEVVIQDDIEFALIQMKSETLIKINEALQRLEDERYGYCFDCASGISQARLRALPFAVRCTDCETARERAFARDRTESRHETSRGFEMTQ